MDKLKNFIEDNREAFDEERLPVGHLDRFEEKLAPRRKDRTILWGIVGFAAAACIALFLLYQLPFQKGFGERQYVCEMKQEIAELQLHYTMRMNEVVLQMEDLYEQEQTPGAAQLLSETKKVLNDTHQFEENILPTLPCSDESLLALTQHYNNSLESMHIMLEYMEQVIEINNAN